MVNIAKLVRKKLGELLVDEGLLRDEQVQEALRKQKESGELLGEALVSLGYVSEVDIARAISKQFGLPYIDASRYQVTKDVANLLPPATCVENRFVVLDKIGKMIIVAVSGVVDARVFEDLEKKAGAPLSLYVSTVGQVMTVLKKLYPDLASGGKGPAKK